MKIHQYEDKYLSHYSYTILSECERQLIVIDPSRDVTPYLNYAKAHEAAIIGIIETHPHADFISGHLELRHATSATIYCSKLLGALYPHQTFDEGDTISFGNIKLKALNTPGHSPDSICVVLEYEGKDEMIFTGDTLFIGDCGRPDLRENAGNLTANRKELAGMMYHSLRDKLLLLNNEVVIYPAHGAGTLCGKALSDANSSTVGAEKLSNWSLQQMDEARFVAMLLQEQPFVPRYFPYDVELNKNGANDLKTALSTIVRADNIQTNEPILIVDTRPEKVFKQSHLAGSVNIQAGGKFETWLGSIVAPGEKFYLTAENDEMLQEAMMRCAKIGYEPFIEQVFVFSQGNKKSEAIDLGGFKAHQQDYTIVDVRNKTEVDNRPVFNDAIKIPLPELRERISEIPAGKPIAVHCAGGYRSAAGSSIIEDAFVGKSKVYDLGEDIKVFG